MRQVSEGLLEADLQNTRDALQNTVPETLVAQGMRAWRNGRRKGLKIPCVAAPKRVLLQNKREICTENYRTNRELQNSLAPLQLGRGA